MGVDTSIIFAPVDSSWVGTPGFIRGLASLFQVTTFEEFCIDRETAPAAGEPLWDKQHKRLLTAHSTPVETAIFHQRTDLNHSTSMMLGKSPFADEVLDEMLTQPVGLLGGLGCFNGFTLTYGAWESYEADDEDDQPSGKGMCKLCLWMDGSPAYGAEKFLPGFLALKTITQLKNDLEALSDQPWKVLLHVW